MRKYIADSKNSGIFVVQNSHILQKYIAAKADLIVRMERKFQRL